MCSVWITPVLKQVWIAGGILICIMSQGMVLGFISCLLPALRAPNSTIKMDLASESWLASSFGPACTIGIFSSCIIMDFFGRRTAYLLGVIPGIVGWLSISFAQNYTTLLAGRILTGMSAGSVTSVGSIVVGEYTSPKYRGIFLNLKTAGVCAGSTIAHILGQYLHWRTFAIVSLAPNIISFLIACTWPESPFWLAWKKKYEESEKSFFWLRGINEDSKSEFKEFIKAQRQSSEKSTTNNSGVNRYIIDFMKKFTKKDFLKPLFITSTAFILFEACGRHVFPTYALQIVGAVVGNVADPHFYTLCIDLIITASAMFSTVLVKLMKRRTLLLSTGFASVFVLALACTYLFLVSRDIISKDRPWIAISLFATYFILANLGCTPIPLALQGEIFPLTHRGVGAAVTGVILSVFLMVLLQITPYLLLDIKVYGTFVVLGSIMFVTLLILYFILPETKDRTLQEIEDYFNNGKYPDVVRHDEEYLRILNVEEHKCQSTSQ